MWDNDLYVSEDKNNLQQQDLEEIPREKAQLILLYPEKKVYLSAYYFTHAFLMLPNVFWIKRVTQQLIIIKIWHRLCLPKQQKTPLRCSEKSFHFPKPSVNRPFLLCLSFDHTALIFSVRQLIFPPIFI